MKWRSKLNVPASVSSNSCDVANHVHDQDGPVGYTRLIQSDYLARG